MSAANGNLGVLNGQMTNVLQGYFTNGVINTSSLPTNLGAIAGIGFSDGCLLKSTASDVLNGQQNQEKTIPGLIERLWGC